MDLPMQRIEFLVEELLLLRSTLGLRVALEVCFLYGSDEAFHALCSLLLFGRDLCSPNKRVKADAKLEFYSKLLTKHHPHCKQPNSRHMTYSEFASSLQSMNDRWATTYSIDELISLAYIVDIDEQGIITYDAYLRFTCEVERAARSNINDPKESLDSLYDHRREVLYAHVMAAIELPELRDKLALLAVLANQCSLQPLHSLHQLSPELRSGKEEVPANYNDSLIGFLLELSDLVNSSIGPEPDAQSSSCMGASFQLADSGFNLPPLSATDNIIDDGMVLTVIDADPTTNDISVIKQPKACGDSTVLTESASLPPIAAAAASTEAVSHRLHDSESHQQDTPVQMSFAADSTHIIVASVIEASIEQIESFMNASDAQSVSPSTGEGGGGESSSELSHKETLLEKISVRLLTTIDRVASFFDDDRVVW